MRTHERRPTLAARRRAHPAAVPRSRKARHTKTATKKEHSLAVKKTQVTEGTRYTALGNTRRNGGFKSTLLLDAPVEPLELPHADVLLDNVHARHLPYGRVRDGVDVALDVLEVLEDEGLAR